MTGPSWRAVGRVEVDPRWAPGCPRVQAWTTGAQLGCLLGLVSRARRPQEGPKPRVRSARVVSGFSRLQRSSFASSLGHLELPILVSRGHRCSGPGSWLGAQ